jgi:putative DNA primase/helicase
MTLFSALQELCDAVVCHDDYDNEFKEELIIKWLVSAYAAAARKDDDGFRNRGVLVLQGKQGIGKTTFLKNLCGENWGGNKKWFGEGLTLDPEVKDSKISAISYWITELAELENTTKRGMPALKAFLTNSVDTLRKPYGVEETNFTRRTVFAGTVNEMGFLSDTTGNSRFWVIPVKEFKDTSKIDMQQVWATVAELYEKGKTWWLTREEEAILEKSNQDYEPENAIADYLEKGLNWEAQKENWEYKTITQALLECGLHEPKALDCRIAGQFIRRQTEIEFKRKKLKGTFKYLLPPKKTKTPDDGFQPVGSDYGNEMWYNNN